MSFKVQPWDGAVTAARIQAQHATTKASFAADRDRAKTATAPRKKSV